MHIPATNSTTIHHQQTQKPEQREISDNVNISSINNSSKIRKRIKRVACSCPNCKGDSNRTGYKKQHNCHIKGCTKAYNKTSHLRAHLRWHEGERPYACSFLFCGKTFTRSDELMRHSRTHTGERSYQCCECNKTFTRSDHLSKHIKTHIKLELALMDTHIKKEKDKEMPESEMGHLADTTSIECIVKTEPLSEESDNDMTDIHKQSSELFSIHCAEKNRTTAIDSIVKTELPTEVYSGSDDPMASTFRTSRESFTDSCPDGGDDEAKGMNAISDSIVKEEREFGGNEFKLDHFTNTKNITSFDGVFKIELMAQANRTSDSGMTGTISQPTDLFSHICPDGVGDHKEGINAFGASTIKKDIDIEGHVKNITSFKGIVKLELTSEASSPSDSAMDGLVCQSLELLSNSYPEGCSGEEKMVTAVDNNTYMGYESSK